MASGTHDGHRERVKQQFLEHGLDSMAAHQIVELLLFFGIPRVDTNPLAHRLVNTFGGLAEVLDADYESLMQVEGMTRNAASLIVLSKQLFREYQKSRHAGIMTLTNTVASSQYILPYFTGRKNEVVVLLCMDNRCRPLNCSVMFEGSVNATEINIRLILQHALRFNASAVILAHNHPNGIALPSPDDIESTRRIASACAIAEVQLLDHFIIGGDGVDENGEMTDFTSMRDTESTRSIFMDMWRFRYSENEAPAKVAYKSSKPRTSSKKTKN